MPYTKHALVIDDEPIICSICSRILVKEGFTVDTAQDGIEGQHILQRQAYDICVMDIKTPGMSGMELYQYLSEKRPDLTNRVLFITGDTMSGNIAQFLRNISGRFLEKPFTPLELIEAVRGIMQDNN